MELVWIFQNQHGTKNSYLQMLQRYCSQNQPFLTILKWKYWLKQSEDLTFGPLQGQNNSIDGIWERCFIWHDKEALEVTDAVMFIIPTESVENGGFRRLLRIVDLRNEIHSFKYFSNTAILLLCSECCGEIQHKF